MRDWTAISSNTKDIAMTKFFSILATTALTLMPVICQAETGEQHAFEHKGRRYVYTIEQKSNYRILRGMETHSQEKFALSVYSKRVMGTFGDSAVSFSLSDVKHLKGIVQVEETSR
jgi:hypothetical protein